MTIAEMRTLLGLGSTLSDAEVADAYAVYLNGVPLIIPQEPVTLAEARKQVGLLPDDGTDDDELLKILIAAAREVVEGLTGLILTRRQVVQHASSFARLDLHAWPIASIDAVTYVDAAGTEQALDPSAWRAALTARPVRLHAAFRETWPILASCTDSIMIIATAGFETPADVPMGLKQAIKMLVGHWYRSREAVVIGSTAVDLPMSVEALCWQHKRWTC